MKVETGVLTELGAEDTAAGLGGGAMRWPPDESGLLPASSTAEELPGGRGVGVGPRASWASRLGTADGVEALGVKGAVGAAGAFREAVTSDARSGARV